MNGTLSPAQVQAMVTRINAGDKFNVIWSDLEEPDVKLNWTCVCVAKESETSLKFTSEDSDDPAEVYPMPNFDEAVPPNLDIIYYDILIPERHARKSMSQHKKKSVMVTTIVAWRRSTWTTALNGDETAQNCLRRELFHQLNIPERFSLSASSTASEQERATLGRILLGMLSITRALPPEQQLASAELEEVYTPLLGRLCELRAGDRATGRERTELMERVRNVVLEEEFKGDRLGMVMMGIKPPTKKA